MSLKSPSKQWVTEKDNRNKKKKIGSWKKTNPFYNLNVSSRVF